MMAVISVLALLLVTFGQYCTAADSKVVCYYNTRHQFREGQGVFNISFIEPALRLCTHLVYGYAAINGETFKLVPLYEKFDVTKNHYREITDLKRRFPGLRVLLSVGGNEDVTEDEHAYTKYFKLLESVSNRLSFIESAHMVVKNYGFDGLDLAWQFPETKPKKIRGVISNFFSKLKKKITGESVRDENPEKHREEFLALVRETHNIFQHDGLLVTVSVLPNVNSTVYFTPSDLKYHVDYVNLMAFDFYTPDRNPKEADYSAPLYEVLNRRHDENVDYQVRYWTKGGMPYNKVILGIPTFGRAWEMTSDSAVNGEPPLTVDGAADKGPYTKEKGLLSYAEICVKIRNTYKPTSSKKKMFIKRVDLTRRMGVYAFRLPDDGDDDDGVWVSFDDVEMAGAKASYAKVHGLGGVSIVDITLDDFRGLCSGEKYPILREAKLGL